MGHSTFHKITSSPIPIKTINTIKMIQNVFQTVLTFLRQQSERFFDDTGSHS